MQLEIKSTNWFIPYFYHYTPYKICICPFIVLYERTIRSRTTFNKLITFQADRVCSLGFFVLNFTIDCPFGSFSSILTLINTTK